MCSTVCFSSFVGRSTIPEIFDGNYCIELKSLNIILLNGKNNAERWKWKQPEVETEFKSMDASQSYSFAFSWIFRRDSYFTYFFNSFRLAERSWREQGGRDFFQLGGTWLFLQICLGTDSRPHAAAILDSQVWPEKILAPARSGGNNMCDRLDGFH